MHKDDIIARAICIARKQSGEGIHRGGSKTRGIHFPPPPLAHNRLQPRTPAQGGNAGRIHLLVGSDLRPRGRLGDVLCAWDSRVPCGLRAAHPGRGDTPPCHLMPSGWATRQRDALRPSHHVPAQRPHQELVAPGRANLPVGLWTVPLIDALAFWLAVYFEPHGPLRSSSRRRAHPGSRQYHY